MVVSNLLWRPRQGFDTNNINFVTIPTNPESTVADPQFVQNTWSTTDWLGPATNDDLGFFTTFLIRPGMRKMNQQKIQVTVKQAGNRFIPTLFSVAFFGLRPVFYDDVSDTVVPLQPYFTMSNFNTLMACDNLRSEFTNPAGITTELEAKGAIPPAIEYASPGGTFYREKLIQDVAQVDIFDHVATVTKGNDVWTTHQVSTPLFPSYPDVYALKDGMALQAKMQIYFTTTDYSLQIPPNPTDAPSLSFLNNTLVTSFSSLVYFT